MVNPRFRIEYEELKEIGTKPDEPEHHRFKVYWHNKLKLDITYQITYPPPLSWPDLDLYNFPMWFAYLAKTERFYNLYKI
ncbi:MAG: hypothetical protein ACFFDN_08680 [Candidatus Hodarchaeota archaeon]